MMRSVKLRLAWLCLLAVPPLAYACSSEGDGPAADLDAGAESSSPTPTPTDGGGPGTPDADPGGDAGSDAGAVDGGDAGATCVGSPLGDAGADGGGLALRTIVTGEFLDGPRWVDGVGLVYSEVFQHRLRRLLPDGGAVTLRDVGGALPIGTTYDPQTGVLVTAQSTPAALLRTRSDGGTLASLTTGAADSPNDVVTSAAGQLFFTDPAYQNANPALTGVYRRPADAGVVAVQTFATVERANGVALSPDQRSLYVSFTNTRRVARYPLSAAGVPGAGVTILTGVELALAPDGIAVDVAGNLYLAEADPDTGMNRGVIEVFRPTGAKWGAIPVAGARPTGVAFGGPTHDTLFITTETSLLSVALACAGLP
jgi:sugar lactone lactonase YvrE